MNSTPPQMISVPKQLLAELEDGFLRLWLTTNNITAQLEMGADILPLIRLLRQELTYALDRFYNWHVAKWAPEDRGGQAS